MSPFTRPDDTATSSVLSIALLVGITILIALVIAALFLGIGQDRTQPQLSIAFEATDDGSSIELVHDGGSELTPENTDALSVEGSGELSIDAVDWPTADQINATAASPTDDIASGERIATVTLKNVSEGDELRVRWRAADLDGTHILDSYTFMDTISEPRALGLSGTVEGSVPAADVTVSLGQNQETIATTTTDETGAYSLDPSIEAGEPIDVWINGYHATTLTDIEAARLDIDIEEDVVASGAAHSVAAVLMDGSGTEADPYRVSTASDLQSVNSELDAHYRLQDDIDASLSTDWSEDGFTPIGDDADGDRSEDPFTGTLDGNGHTIDGLWIDRSEGDVALIGQLDESGTVRDLRISDAHISGEWAVGGVVGTMTAFSDTTITAVTLENSSITATGRAGGLVGQGAGTIADSHVRGSTVTSDGRGVGGIAGTTFGDLTQVSSTAPVDGETRVGGIAGMADGILGGSVSDSYATGDVTADDGSAGGAVARVSNDGALERTYSVGNVTGSDRAGGLIANLDGSVDDAYWDDEAATVIESGTELDTHTAGGTALSTSEMQGTDPAMSGFDEPPWELAAERYPLLVTAS